MAAVDLKNTLKEAQRQRDAKAWSAALELYLLLESDLRGQAAYHHNVALCYLGMGKVAEALEQANAATGLNPLLWQATLVKVRALSALQRQDEALVALRLLTARFPQNASVAIELADLVLHHDCDARAAKKIVTPWVNSAASAADAQLGFLMASLYDRQVSASHLNTQIKTYAATYLTPETSATAAPKSESAARRLATARRKRLRVGLLSPHFSCSPVYFFCFAALELLSHEVDFVCFNRGKNSDWASQKFQSIAKEWYEVESQDAQALAVTIGANQLDCLIDLGGWMDPVALRAIAGKPAKRMYKWVGGQSVTTGLGAFDGFLTDAAQTPADFESWFTEPLIRLPGGYVTYLQPDYLPSPVAPNTQATVLGVIANPVKVSGGFLQTLLRQLTGVSPEAQAPGLPVELRFIDKRYGNPRLQQRIMQALDPLLQQRQGGLTLRFVTPASHIEYLTEVGRLSEVVDTHPYAGGLTTIEALAMGVPCSSYTNGQAGELFCERHTHSHLFYASLPANGKPRPAVRPAKSKSQARKSLLAGSMRLNHQALAESLSQLLRTGSLK